MLTEEELRRYFKLHNVPLAAQEYIRFVRLTEPARRVGIGARVNRSSSMYSYKMGRTIQIESEGPEGTFYLINESSDDCFEIWDQLHSVAVELHFKNGRTQRRPHIADFLILLKSGPCVVECKTANEAHKLVKTRKNDWSYENGQFHFIAAEKAFAKYGLKHVVFVPGNGHQLLASNLGLLSRARHSPDQTTPAILSILKASLAEKPIQTLLELKRQCGLEDNTPLLKLIDSNVLCTRPSIDNLSEEAAALISASPEFFEAINETSVTDTQSLPTATIQNLPPATFLKTGLLNLKKLDDPSASNRTQRHLRKKILEGELSGLSPLVSVTPRWSLCGNRTIRLNPIQINTIEEFFENKMQSLDRGVCEIHRQYEGFAKKAHPKFDPIGRTAFSLRLKARPLAVARATGGKRAENAAMPACDIGDRVLPPQRPFEFAHIDHFNADIHLCVNEIGAKKFVTRVWITVMVDHFSGAILAIWISTKNPSRRACAMVLRRCLRRHGRLPESILTDHGAEFESIYYVSLLAFCKINKKERPAAHGRFGSEAERVFIFFIKKYLRKRPGYIQSIFNRRSRSSSHSSERTAQLTPEIFFEEFMEFIEWYNTIYIAPNRHAPAAVLLAEKLRSYSCSGIVMDYDDRFTIASSIEAKAYAVNPSRGIQTPVGWFVNSALQILAGVKKKKPDVLEDPEEPYRIYVLLKDKWITARHALDSVFQTKPAHQRCGDALRVLDATSTRTEVKQHADQMLNDKIAEFDKRLDASKQSPVKTPKECKPPSPSEALEKSCRKPVTPMPEFKLEVDHELV